MFPSFVMDRARTIIDAGWVAIIALFLWTVRSGGVSGTAEVCFNVLEGAH